MIKKLYENVKFPKKAKLENLSDEQLKALLHETRQKLRNIMSELPKSEFNRIIHTHTKEEWVDQAISLCRKNNYKLTESQFYKLCKSSFDPSNAAYNIVMHAYADTEWAKKVIENDKTGNPSWHAYRMVENGNADSEWAKKVIENDKTGNPSGAAYEMVNSGYTDSEWAKKVIENDKSGDPSLAAYWLVYNGYADKNWYKKVTGEKYK